MKKKIAKLGLYWLGSAAVAPLLAAACAGPPLSLGDTAGAGGNVSAAGSSASGGTMSGGSSSGAVGGSSQETCDKSACGPQLGLLNQLCADGSMSGPTGRCLKRANGSCGWEVLQCPPDGTGGDASAGGPSTGGSSTGGSSRGGSSTGGSSGGSSGGPCGGNTCTVDQRCCGPAECGRCIPAASGQFCPDICPGSGGSGGTGGAPDCTQLLAEVTKTQAAAQACNPLSGAAVICAGSLQGLCCPIGVESADMTSSANAAYLSALKAYNNGPCVYQCPEIACFAPKVGDCVASSASTGKCGP